jgi:hypothetical protein
MWKPILAGAVAIAVVGSSMVYAQQRGRPGGFERYQPNIEDMRAFSEARLAALHAGLGLNPDQEKNWPAFEQASREMSKLRIDRVGAAVNRQRDRQPQSNDPADRMHRRAEQMTQSGAALKKVADAFDPLYKSLDDGQKRRFAMLERFMAPRDGGAPGREFRGRDGFDRDGRDGGPRRLEGGPRRTDYTPQAPVGGEEQL